MTDHSVSKCQGGSSTQPCTKPPFIWYQYMPSGAVVGYCYDHYTITLDLKRTRTLETLEEALVAEVMGS